MPLFSVIVPVYNHERYIGAALDSLLAQTCPDWEAVVVNDGSTDGTAAAIEDYARRDPRIRVFHKPNGGVSTALNRGITEAKGDWILWLSSDDWFGPDKLAQHRLYAEKFPECRFFFSDAGNFREAESLRTKSWVAKVWDPPWQVLGQLERNFVVTISVSIHREALKHVGLFDEELRMAQDYKMWLRLMAWRPTVHIPMDLCTERQHNMQNTVRQRPVLFFDSAVAGIDFLNQTPFAGTVQGANLSDPDTALSFLDRAIDVAGHPYSFLYALGPHHALVLRLMEWIWSVPDRSLGARLKAHFGRRARAFALTHGDSHLGFIWKMAAAGDEIDPGRIAYQPVCWRSLIRSQHRRWVAERDDRASSLVAYAKRFGIEPMESDPCGGRARMSVLVSGDGGTLDVCDRLAEEGHSVGRLQTGAAQFDVSGQCFVLGGRGVRLLMGLATEPPVDMHVSVGHDNLAWLRLGRRCNRSRVPLSMEPLVSAPSGEKECGRVVQAVARRLAQLRRLAGRRY
jgi:glycosyltransferase involved in cell wall biosynthesis